MKTYLLKPMVVVCLCLLTASFTFAADNYKMVKVKAPFPMQPIKVFIYPDKDFLITDYGAKNGGEVNNTKAIAAAIEACHKSGGGRVVVPAGIWLTGASRCRWRKRKSSGGFRCTWNKVYRFGLSWKCSCYG